MSLGLMMIPAVVLHYRSRSIGIFSFLLEGGDAQKDYRKTYPE